MYGEFFTFPGSPSHPDFYENEMGRRFFSEKQWSCETMEKTIFLSYDDIFAYSK